MYDKVDELFLQLTELFTVILLRNIAFLNAFIVALIICKFSCVWTPLETLSEISISVLATTSTDGSF